MATPVSNSVPLSGSALTDGLVQGSAWTFDGGPRTVTYSLSLNFDGPVQAWSSSWTTAVANAFAAWSAVANVQFVQAGGGQPINQSTADIAMALVPGEGEGAILALGVFPSPAYATTLLATLEYTRTQYPRIEGDVVFDSAPPPGSPFSSVFSNLAGGGAGFSIILHELGHALGLKHPNDDGGNARPTFSQLGIGAQQSLKYTVMATYESVMPSAQGFPATPMPLDILAIQRIYGANTTYHTGNDVYAILNDSAARTIWDAGGVDTIDASSQTSGVTIDLRPGGYSTRETFAGPLGNVALAVAYNTTIENAIGGAGNDIITGNNAANNLSGGDGSDTLDGGPGNDTMTGGIGDDTFVLDAAAGDVVIELPGEGFDTVKSPFTYSLQNDLNLENVTLTGTANINATGNDLPNVITGNSGNNTLIGGAGFDQLNGGAGNDTYLLGDDTGDLVGEFSSQGTDTVIASASYALPDHVENLTLTGSANVSGTGNFLVNLITGNDGSNVLDGQGGADVLNGGAGNDTYYVDGADTLIETPGGGLDEVRTTVNYTLPDHIENLRLWAENLSGTGNALANGISGSSGKDLLDGGAGSDTLTGGMGDDTYVVDGADTVIEAAGEGVDLVLSPVTHELAANFENLTLIGAANVNATGNELENAITGNAGNNILAGGAGLDHLSGGAGNDTYILNDTAPFTYVRIDKPASSALVFPGGSSSLTLTDSPEVPGTLVDTIDWVIDSGGTIIHLSTRMLGQPLQVGLYTNAERFPSVPPPGTPPHPGLWIAHDHTGPNSVTGSFEVLAAEFDYSGATPQVVDLLVTFDQLGDGFLHWTGTIAINHFQPGPGDTIVENPNAGIDTVQTVFSYALPANLENLTLTGTDDVNGTGNALDNVLAGNSGVNTLAGGAGNDTYIVDDAGDTLIEGDGGGIDLVMSAMSFQLAGHFENLTLTGADPLSATGNAAANVLTGNSGDNTLDGLGGADTMAGAGGDDTYIVVEAGDTVIEAAGGGSDLVLSAVSLTLAGNVEKLTLTGGAIGATGNRLANVLTGNGENNVLDGGGGADSMAGGAGDDTYHVGSADDALSEEPGGGLDVVLAAADFALAPEVENLILIGVAMNGAGNAQANVLTANALASTLAGGGGDDTYFLRSGADVVIEEAGGGTDTVHSAASYALSEDVENLLLEGMQPVNATGNGGQNLLVGNTRANVLDGAGGADVMAGGGGGDTYVVDDVGDEMEEFADGGVDLVIASVSYTLPAHVERLVLTGTQDLAGVGNALANVLTGNAGDNFLDGGAGRDVLIGGAGDDTYVVTPGDRVVEAQNGGVDTVLSARSYTLAAHLENLTLSGTGDAGGTGNALDNVLAGNGGRNYLDGGIGADTLDGGGGDDVLIFDARDAMVAGGAGHDVLRFKGFNQSLDLTQIADGIYTGIEAIDLTGQGRNSLTLDAIDVLALSDTDDLLVDGSATSRLTLAGGGWAGDVSSVIGDTPYRHYSAGGATVTVDEEIQVVLA